MAASRCFFGAAASIIVSSVVVMRLVLSLGVHALVGLACVAPLGRPKGLLPRALRSNGRQ
jgi:hypothetical protein